MSAAASPLGALWRWNVRHSPIARRVRPHRYARAVIDAAALPAPVRDRIDAIVRRTRLWADEREDIARELAAHAADALAAGRSERETITSLGDPRPVARLIRRATKRKRPWPYQARLWATRAAAVLAITIALVYGVLAVRFFTGEPNIATDYMAQLNAAHDHLADDQRAWRVYEDAWIAWQREDRRLHDTSAVPTPQNSEDWPAIDAAQSTGFLPGAQQLPRLPDAHPDAPAVRAAIVAFRPTLDAVADAANRPAIGFPYTNRLDEIPVEGLDVLRLEPLPPDRSPGVDGSTINVLLPMLGRARLLARLLAADAHAAAEEADAGLATRRLEALFLMSRQMAREPFLIGRLVAIALHAMALDTTDRLLHAHPGLFDQRQLATLAHAAHASGRACHDLNIESERAFFDDILQRLYTDDGRGDGRLTPEGVRRLFDLSGDARLGAPTSAADLLAQATGPALAIAVGSRAEQRARYDAVMDATRRVLDEGPRAWPQLETAMARIDEGPETRGMVARILAPAMNKAVQTVFRARMATDATLTAIAIETHRLRTGALPGSLEELVPAELPALPRDLFTDHAALLYRPRPDGTYTLYARGPDADDDGARPATDDRGHPLDTRQIADFTPRETASPAPDGDWILYPPRPD